MSHYLKMGKGVGWGELLGINKNPNIMQFLKQNNGYFISRKGAGQREMKVELLGFQS